MKTIWKGAVLAALFFALTSCGSDNGGNTLITSDGVGNFAFGQETPDFGKGYTAEPSVMYFDDDEGYPYFVIKDKNGNLIANVFPESVEVFSPEFRTEAGIHAGMNLHEAAQMVGEENLHIWLGWPNNYFTIEDTTTGFAWNVYGDQLNGGDDRFQEISLNGIPVTLVEFSPQAKIAWITVIDFSEED